MKPNYCHKLLSPLLLAALVWTTAAHAQVRVHGVASSTGDLITVQLLADILEIPIISYTARVYYDPAMLQIVQAYRDDSVWYLSDGANHVPYMQPDSSQRGEVLFVGGKMDALDPLAGVTGLDVPLGTVVFTRLNPGIPEFGLGLGHAGGFASFVTVKGETLEGQSGNLLWDPINPTPDDRDLDSLSDEWETRYFKDPSEVSYNDDSDEDGIDNGGEEDLGSDPTDPDSNLRLAIRGGKGQIQLLWDSYRGKTYTLEGAEELNRFKAVQTGIRATPPFNSLELDLSENSETRFFRILLEPSGE